jgi:hypothetical protein
MARAAKVDLFYRSKRFLADLFRRRKRRLIGHLFRRDIFEALF